MTSKTRGGVRPGAGRKKSHPLLKKTQRTLKLPEWMWKEIAKYGSRPHVIEKALVEKYGFKPPEINS